MSLHSIKHTTSSQHCALPNQGHVLHLGGLWCNCSSERMIPIATAVLRLISPPLWEGNPPQSEPSFAVTQAQQSRGAVTGAPVTLGAFHLSTETGRECTLLLSQSVNQMGHDRAAARQQIASLQENAFHSPLQSLGRAACPSQHTVTGSGERVKGYFCQTGIFKFLSLKRN